MKRSRAFWYEAPIFIAAVWGIGRMVWPLAPAFLGVEPHPFWIAIVVVGVRYGILAGAYTGICAALCYIVAIFFSVERYQLEDSAFYVLPGVFLIGGLGLGFATERLRVLLAVKQIQHHHDAQRIDELREALHTEQDIVRGLEQRIVSKMATLVTLYEGARTLETVELDALYPAITQFLAHALEADEVALYLKVDGGWKLCSSVGWPEYAQRPTTLEPRQGIVGLAGSENRVLSVRDLLANAETGQWPTLLGDAIFAGPIRCGESGDVVGVVGIQRMPLLQFHGATVNLFTFLLTWASRAVERATYVGRLRASEVIDPTLGIYTARYFERRVQQEFARAQQFRAPLFLCTARLLDTASLPSTTRERAERLLVATLKYSLDDLDVVAHFPGAASTFACLPMVTDAAHARALIDTITARLANVLVTPLCWSIQMSDSTAGATLADFLAPHAANIASSHTDRISDSPPSPVEST